MDGKITADELCGTTPKGNTKAKAAKKPNKRDEDDIQRRAIAWMEQHYPDVPVYGNATANIFMSGGLYKKALPKTMYGTLRAMGINATTWGTLLDYALSKCGLKLTVAALERDQEGAKFAQMRRTKEMGAVASWPDIGIYAQRHIKVQIYDGSMRVKPFGGLFCELKKPDAYALPFGKDGNGKFSTIDKLQAQGAMLSRLANQGYMAMFCIGYEEFEAAAAIYFDRDFPDRDKWLIQEVRVPFKDGQSGIIYRIRRIN